MNIILFINAVIAWTGFFYWRSKAKEFESLFELSKSYEFGFDDKLLAQIKPPKLNKDGSIAKKRGRPVGSKKK